MTAAAVAIHYAEPDAWDDAAFEVAERSFSALEHQRAAAFRFERDRRLYIAAHGMVRAVLAERVGVGRAELAFQHSVHGRPELDHDAGLRFSLSHAQGMAVCAVTTAHDVGVDVEPLDRPVRMAIAERWFAAAELEDLCGCSEHDRAERFYTYWTLKEAYVKARGIGLGLGMQKVAFELEPQGIRFRPAADVEAAPDAWHFRCFRLGTRHQAALAIRAPRAPSLTVLAFSPEALL